MCKLNCNMPCLVSLYCANRESQKLFAGHRHQWQRADLPEHGLFIRCSGERTERQSRWSGHCDRRRCRGAQQPFELCAHFRLGKRCVLIESKHRRVHTYREPRLWTGWYTGKNPYAITSNNKVLCRMKSSMAMIVAILILGAINVLLQILWNIWLINQKKSKDRILLIDHSRML